MAPDLTSSDATVQNCPTNSFQLRTKFHKDVRKGSFRIFGGISMIQQRAFSTCSCWMTSQGVVQLSCGLVAKLVFKGELPALWRVTLPHITGQACPQVFVGLYLATAQALGHLATMLTNYPSPPWPADKCPEVFAVATLEESIQLRHDEAIPLSEVDQQFDDLLHGNYDCSVEDEHKGKVLHGYADCGLPLILSHNTPNNSLYLLWEGTRTRPLFPRFERHQGRLGGE